MPTLAAENAQKVGGKIHEISKLFRVTDSHGVEKTQPAHPVGYSRINS